jgi:hypothetical protein
MAHTFSVTIPEGLDLKAGVEKVKAGVIAAGGKYQFDGTKGMFEVKGVSGAFFVAGRIVTITISKKPFIVSNGYVESTIRDYFKQAA